MSTAVASDFTVPLAGGKIQFLLRRLHSLTGIVFGGYLVVHLVVNATIAQGGGVYQEQVNKIHGLPWLPVVEWTFIFLPIIYHTLYGIWIYLSGQANVTHYPYYRNWFYVLQRYSAFYIVAFLAFHVLSLKYGLFGTSLAFEPHRATATIIHHMDTAPALMWLVYGLGILASAFHTANGFWTAAISWGLTISAGAQRRWGYVCVGLFALLFIAGMIALVAAQTMAAPVMPTNHEII